VSAPLEGAAITRRKLFESSTTVNGWASNMLVAIHTAQTLGYTLFEMGMSGAPSPSAQPQNSAFYGALLGTPEPWQDSAVKAPPCVIAVYAGVVE